MASLSITARTISSPEQAKTQALVLLLPERKTLHQDVKALDAQLRGTISRSIKLGDFTGAASTLWLPGSASAQRVLRWDVATHPPLPPARLKGSVAAEALVASPAVEAIITLHARGQTRRRALIEQLSLQLSLASIQPDIESA